jgi:protein SCO1
VRRWEVETVRSLARNVAFLAPALAAFLLAFAGASPDVRRIPLVDQRGAVFRLADLRGRPVVITFVATRCTDACPIADAEFSRLAGRLRHDGVHATLLTVTLDPAFDSPFVMARAAHRYDADPKTWRFVSGTARDVRAVMASFGVVATPGRDGIPEVHSSFVYVLDSHVRLARTLLLSSNLPDDVAALFRGRHAVR